QVRIQPPALAETDQVDRVDRAGAHLERVDLTVTLLLLGVEGILAGEGAARLEDDLAAGGLDERLLADLAAPALALGQAGPALAVVVHRHVHVLGDAAADAAVDADDAPLQVEEGAAAV